MLCSARYPRWGAGMTEKGARVCDGRWGAGVAGDVDGHRRALGADSRSGAGMTEKRERE